ncbi:unnamed protein product [Closterium sp. Naga37s-1]|nr:unnamed protein product [Closterium sp. Naga37s-1]
MFHGATTGFPLSSPLPPSPPLPPVPPHFPYFLPTSPNFLPTSPISSTSPISFPLPHFLHFPQPPHFPYFLPTSPISFPLPPFPPHSPHFLPASPISFPLPPFPSHFPHFLPTPPISSPLPPSSPHFPHLLPFSLPPIHRSLGDDPWVMVRVPQGAEQVPASQPNAGSVGGRNQMHRMLQRQLFIKEQWQKVKEQQKEALKRRDEERRARWKAGAARAREWRERQLAAAGGGEGGREGTGGTA